MRSTSKVVLYGRLCSVGLFLSACSGAGDSEPGIVIDSDSGDAFEPPEYFPTRTTDKGVAPSKDTAELLDDGEVVTDAITVTTDGGDASVDASGDAAELLDANDGAGELDAQTDAAELLDANDGAGELDAGNAELDAQTDAADCNPIGRWQVYINPRIICFRLSGPEGFFINVEAASGCHVDLEISLDINEPESLYGRFIGTITYHVDFTEDTLTPLTGNAEIVGTVTNGGGSMDCITTAYITGVLR